MLPSSSADDKRVNSESSTSGVASLDSDGDVESLDGVPRKSADGKVQLYMPVYYC